MNVRGGFWDKEAEVAPSYAVTPLYPPTGYLAWAGLSVAASLVIWLIHPTSLLSLAGWALGSVFTVWLVSRFVVVDAERKLNANYSPKPSLRSVRLVVLCGGILVAALNAWAFATDVAAK